MARWNSLEWDALVRGDLCPICNRGRPHSIVAELEGSFVTATEDAPLWGHTCVVARRHVVELYDMEPEELSMFMAEVSNVARAVAGISNAVKMNYEIHGNSIPHLHVHLFPRVRGDRFEDRPIDPSEPAPCPYAPGEFDAFKVALQSRLRPTLVGY